MPANQKLEHASPFLADSGVIATAQRHRVRLGDPRIATGSREKGGAGLGCHAIPLVVLDVTVNRRDARRQGV